MKNQKKQMPGYKTPGILFMATVRHLYNRMKAFSVENTASTVFGNLSEAFTAENKKQLFEGYNKFGLHLQEYKTANYAFYKYSKNPVPGLGNPDLFDTGAFYDHIQTSIVNLSIIEESSDPKNDELVLKYPGIFGLGGIYKEEFVKEKYQPSFFTEVRKRIFG